MAAAAQGNRAGRDAGSSPSGPRHIDRSRPVRCNPGRRALARGGGKRDQRARLQRDRAPLDGLCALMGVTQQRSAARLARPGVNVTGVSYIGGPEIFGKDLELLRDLRGRKTITESEFSTSGVEPRWFVPYVDS